MNKLAVISLCAASAMATATPKDYFCTVKVAKYDDKATCEADTDGTKGTDDAEGAAAFTKAAQAANAK